MRCAYTHAHNTLKVELGWRAPSKRHQSSVKVESVDLGLKVNLGPLTPYRIKKIQAYFLLQDREDIGLLPTLGQRRYRSTSCSPGQKKQATSYSRKVKIQAYLHTPGQRRYGPTSRIEDIQAYFYCLYIFVQLKLG